MVRPANDAGRSVRRTCRDPWRPLTVVAPKRRFKNDVYAALARIPAALANPHRLEILDELVGNRPRTVADLAAEAALSVANSSQHLQVLAKCGLVTVERHGTHAFYKAAGANVRLLQSLRDVADQNDAQVAAAVKKHLGNRDVGITSLETVRALIADPHVALLDTHPS